ncbi:MAG: polysaccharide biosynthesis protein, partial [Desulfobacteraceae bacterium]
MTKSIARNLLIVSGTDVVLIAGSWYCANLLRFNFYIPEEHMGSVVRFLPMMLAAKIVLFYLFDLYRGMWRYTGLYDLLNIIKAVSAGSLVVVALISFTH